MITKNSLLLSIVLIVICCFSCKKEPRKEDCHENYDQLVPINDCLSGYFFDQGSYWVYQDTITLQTDSVWVTSWNPAPRSHTSTYGNTICTMTTTNEKIEINYSSSSSGSWQEVLEHQKTIRSENRVYGSLCPSHNDNTVDSLVVSGTTYYNVVCLGLPYQAYYYAPNVGLIRMVDIDLPNSITTRDLINHQVNLFPNPF